MPPFPVKPAESPARGFDIVVIAASAGGPKTLREIFQLLPRNFPAPVVVVQHLAASPPSSLVEFLSRDCALPVQWVERAEQLEAGCVYLAPPDRHLAIRAGNICESYSGPRVNFAIPSADPLFTSAATEFGSRTLGVVLTGRLRDAAAGARAIRDVGGVVVAQEPSTCVADGMPNATIKQGSACFILSPRGIASAMITLVMVAGSPGILDAAAARQN
jgi:two-component system, chemotaxis family, protein-glutamate methylesterase/glutaminase